MARSQYLSRRGVRWRPRPDGFQVGVVLVYLGIMAAVVLLVLLYMTFKGGVDTQINGS